MLGRTPGNIVAIRPMKDGVIADFEVTEKMLDHFIKKAHGRSLFVRPRIVISVPSGITQVEKRAVQDSAMRAGASEVFLVEQAMMAAIGAGLPITEPSGNMIVDIGGGTTDVAVISLAGIVYSRSVRMACNEMDEAIIQYLKRKYNLLIGERTAEQIKIEIGSAYPLDEPLTMEIKGRDLVEGVPKTLMLTDEEIREALAEVVAAIVEAVRMALERTPPELSADIMDKGIMISGGGALLRNLDRRLSRGDGPAGLLAEDPLASVVLGTGAMLTDMDLLRKNQHLRPDAEPGRTARTAQRIRIIFGAMRPHNPHVEIAAVNPRRGGAVLATVLVACVLILSAQAPRAGRPRHGAPVLDPERPRRRSRRRSARSRSGVSGAIDSTAEIFSARAENERLRSELEARDRELFRLRAEMRQIAAASGAWSAPAPRFRESSAACRSCWSSSGPGSTAPSIGAGAWTA